MQFKRSVTTVRTWQLYGGPVVCSNTDGGSCGEVTSIRGWVCLLETEIQKWGTNLVSTVWTRKYKEQNKFWCEQMFVKFNCFFQVVIFHVTLGYRMDDSGITSVAGTRDFSHCLKHSDWVRCPPPTPTYWVCTDGSCFRGKTAMVWGRPFTSSQCWVLNEWSYTSTAPYAVIKCTATTFPFLLIQPLTPLLRGLMRFSLSSDA